MGSFSVKVPREEATKAQGRAAEAGTGPPSPCVTARGRGVPLAQEAPGRSEATARPPQRSQPISTAHGSSTVFVLMERPKFCGHRFPGGVCSLVWERGRGEYRVVHSQDISLLSTLSWALGVRCGRPGCYRACRRQGRRWPRRAWRWEEESMRSASPGDPVGLVPKFCLACRLLRLLPMVPRAPALR